MAIYSVFFSILAHSACLTSDMAKSQVSNIELSQQHIAPRVRTSLLCRRYVRHLTGAEAITYANDFKQFNQEKKAFFITGRFSNADGEGKKTFLRS